jgi:hypothetical protein
MEEKFFSKNVLNTRLFFSFIPAIISMKAVFPKSSFKNKKYIDKSIIPYNPISKRFDHANIIITK